MARDDWQLADALEQIAFQLDPPERTDQAMVIRDPVPVMEVLREARARLLKYARRRPGRPGRDVRDAARFGARVLRWWLVLVLRYRLAGGNRGWQGWRGLSRSARNRLKHWNILAPESPREAALSIVEAETGIGVSTLRRYVGDAARELNFDLRDLAELVRTPYAVHVVKDDVKPIVMAIDVHRAAIRRHLKQPFLTAEQRLRQ